MMLRTPRSRLAAVLAAAAVPLALAAGGAGAQSGGVGPGGDDGNPCTGPERHRFLCPDLRVPPASDLYVDRRGRNTVLRAANDIRSRGRGPMELRARRYKPRWMRANQAIYKVDGGVRIFRTPAKVHYFSVGARWGGSYWKVHAPLRMSIWKIDSQRRLVRRVRTGPKLFYCFRDLQRTSTMRGSPPGPVYPACNQNPNRRRVTLGTSVGWSDIYPSTYHRQWVNVSGLRGCFAYVMQVDPLGRLFESNEKNNRSKRVVRLPYRGAATRGC